MRAQAKTNTGKIRESNEDSHLLCLEEGLFAVADGMGGHQAGEVASRLAVDILGRVVRGAERDAAAGNTLPAGGPAALLERAVAEANRAIYKLASRDADKAGMGTTLTAVIVAGDWLYAAHVGDSRLYFWREGTLRLLTGDHSVVAEMVKRGGLTKAQAQRHPQRHVLTRALGTSPEVRMDSLRQRLNKGDRLLLCTDGLSNLVEEPEMERIMGGPWEEAASALVELALDRGGHDNITVLAVEV